MNIDLDFRISIIAGRSGSGMGFEARKSQLNDWRQGRGK
jgi:hypothetical protein